MSSPAEPSPKRQRRSYSPASPPLHSDTKAAAHHPHTPPPSVHMSPSWHSQSTTTSQPVSANASATFPTPPSTAGFHGQHITGDTAGSERGTDSEMQTPMAEYESALPLKRDDDRDEDMADELEPGQQSGPPAANDLGHRRTDHEREGTGRAAMAEDLLPVRRLYTMCTQPIEPSQPHATNNFIELYCLQRVQASVARRDVAGNKINKLRKSYENKVKNLGLEGRSKAQVGNAALQGLVDPGWDLDAGNGVTAWEARANEFGLSKSSIEHVLGQLDTALALAPGHLPPKEHEQWKNTLGLDGSGAKTTPTLIPSKPPSAAAFLARSEPGAAVRSSAPASPRQAHRPDRMGKKRRYDESSYTGYQEGYDDDGYSTGGLDESGNRRASGFKRQKVQQQRKIGVNEGM